MEKKFEKVSANPNNSKWNLMIKRENTLYKRPNDMRTEFERDYTRIIHSNAFRRLKHKTQVFFSPKSDHICTRAEHVNHVESISYTIAKSLGLNTELTKAIAMAHDLGHSPFGHRGEAILSEICIRDLGYTFWHEKNGLNLVDNIELLEDNNLIKQNLNLTYAVRDGIISHCGEIDENMLKPREEYIDLNDYSRPNEYAPYTWEGCVVKLADKISYIGRDIEDAIAFNILSKNQINELNQLISDVKKEKVNNTVIINDLIIDVCKNSTPENGLCFSEECFKMLNTIKKFNYENIYKSNRVKKSIKYFELILNEIYDTLKSAYNGINTLESLEKMKLYYPNLITNFIDWINNYWDLNMRKDNIINNKVIYNIENEKDYYRAIIDYISGMTDNYAMKSYEEIISF